MTVMLGLFKPKDNTQLVLSRTYTRTSTGCGRFKSVIDI